MWVLQAVPLQQHRPSKLEMVEDSRWIRNEKRWGAIVRVIEDLFEDTATDRKRQRPTRPAGISICWIAADPFLQSMQLLCNRLCCSNNEIVTAQKGGREVLTLNNPKKRAFSECSRPMVDLFQVFCWLCNTLRSLARPRKPGIWPSSEPPFSRRRLKIPAIRSPPLRKPHEIPLSSRKWMG